MTRIEYLKAAEQWAETRKERLGIDGGPEASNTESWAEKIAEEQSEDSEAFQSADEFKAHLDELANENN
jgi:hypothetical protein